VEKDVNMLNFNLRLSEGAASIEKKIQQEIKKKIVAVFVQTTPRILSRIKEAVRLAIMTSPEIESLLGGKLQAELGVPNPTAALEDMLSVWLSNIGITSRVGLKKSTLTLFGIRDDWGDVLSLPSVKYSATTRVIPWLEWLLLAGDSTLIRSYDVSFVVPPGKKSRTGKAVMVRSKRNWGVPPEYSGTAHDNVITRAIINGGVYASVTKIMETELMRAM